MGEKQERTAHGLREMLFDLLDGLRDGTISTRKARVQCEVAARIIDTGRLELAMVQAARQGLELAAMIEGNEPKGLLKE